MIPLDLPFTAHPRAGLFYVPKSLIQEGSAENSLNIDAPLSLCYHFGRSDNTSGGQR
jgi:hypothetical protein